MSTLLLHPEACAQPCVLIDVRVYDLLLPTSEHLLQTVRPVPVAVGVLVVLVVVVALEIFLSIHGNHPNLFSVHLAHSLREIRHGSQFYQNRDPIV
jgi:hypothetical protein